MYDYEDIISINNPDCESEPILDISTNDKGESTPF